MAGGAEHAHPLQVGRDLSPACWCWPPHSWSAPGCAGRRSGRLAPGRTPRPRRHPPTGKSTTG